MEVSTTAAEASQNGEWQEEIADDKQSSAKNRLSAKNGQESEVVYSTGLSEDDKYERRHDELKPPTAPSDDQHDSLCYHPLETEGKTGRKGNKDDERRQHGTDERQPGTTSQLAVCSRMPHPVEHIRGPLIRSTPPTPRQLPSSGSLSLDHTSAGSIRVPLERLERDRPDLRKYFEHSVVHMDYLVNQVCCLENCSSTTKANTSSGSASAGQLCSLWSARVAGVELMLTGLLPASEDERKILAKLASSIRLHIVPGRKIMQPAGEPAAAWENRCWCLACGCNWHPLAECPLVVRLVRRMIDEGWEVSFEKGFCLRCGYLGHSAENCRARLDPFFRRLWKGYKAGHRRWSCLEFVFPDVPLEPLAADLRAQGYTRELQDIPRHPMSQDQQQNFCLSSRRCSASCCENTPRFSSSRPPQPSAALPTILGEQLAIPEPAAHAASNPLRLMLCVTAWMNVCSFGAQELSLLGHRLEWRVSRQASLPFGGFHELGVHDHFAALTALDPRVAAAVQHYSQCRHSAPSGTLARHRHHEHRARPSRRRRVAQPSQTRRSRHRTCGNSPSNDPAQTDSKSFLLLALMNLKLFLLV